MIDETLDIHIHLALAIDLAKGYPGIFDAGLVYIVLILDIILLPNRLYLV